jgi:hypothetical protein
VWDRSASALAVGAVGEPPAQAESRQTPRIGQLARVKRQCYPFFSLSPNAFSSFLIFGTATAATYGWPGFRATKFW